MNEILYKLLSIILILIISIIYFKIRYKFWSKQPVFHYYNIFYWIKPSGIIQKKIPNINSKFYDFNLKHISFNKLNNKERLLIYGLLKTYYLKENFLNNNIKKTFFTYFKNNENCFFSLKYGLYGDLNGIISSRNLNCYIKNKNIIKINYFDFLCTKNKNKNKKENLIYTHYLNTRKKNKNAIYLFKNNGNQKFIVPFVKYESFLYNISFNNILYYLTEDTSIKYILINTSNIKILYHYLNNIKKKINYVFLPNLNNIYNQIKKKILIIGVALKNNIPICIYFFKNTNILYKKKKIIKCVGSYFSFNELYFINGFSKIIRLINNDFSYLIIDDILFNNIIIKKILKKEIKIKKFIKAFYFYNFITYNVSNNDFLIIE